MSEMRQSERRRQRAGRPRHPAAPAYSPAYLSRQGEHQAEVIAADPDLRNFLRAPYDPLYEARAARFFTGGLLSAASSGGRVHAGVLIVALLALLGMVVGLGIALDAVIAREGLWGTAAIWSLLFAAMSGLLGSALLRRLRRAPSR